MKPEKIIFTLLALQAALGKVLADGAHQVEKAENRDDDTSPSLPNVVDSPFANIIDDKQLAAALSVTNERRDEGERARASGQEARQKPPRPLGKGGRMQKMRTDKKHELTKEELKKRVREAQQKVVEQLVDAKSLSELQKAGVEPITLDLDNGLTATLSTISGETTALDVNLKIGNGSVSTDIQVNSFTSANQDLSDAKLIQDSATGKNFIVVAFNSDNLDGDSLSAALRIFDINGNPIGIIGGNDATRETAVNALVGDTKDNQSDPKITSLVPDFPGHFRVNWRSDNADAITSKIVKIENGIASFVDEPSLSATATISITPSITATLTPRPTPPISPTKTPSPTPSIGHNALVTGNLGNCTIYIDKSKDGSLQQHEVANGQATSKTKGGGVVDGIVVGGVFVVSFESFPESQYGQFNFTNSTGNATSSEFAEGFACDPAKVFFRIDNSTLNKIFNLTGTNNNFYQPEGENLLPNQFGIKNNQGQDLHFKIEPLELSEEDRNSGNNRTGYQIVPIAEFEKGPEIDPNSPTPEGDEPSKDEFDWLPVAAGLVGGMLLIPICCYAVCGIVNRRNRNNEQGQRVEMRTVVGEGGRGAGSRE